MEWTWNHSPSKPWESRLKATLWGEPQVLIRYLRGRRETRLLIYSYVVRLVWATLWEHCSVLVLHSHAHSHTHRHTHTENRVEGDTKIETHECTIFAYLMYSHMMVLVLIWVWTTMLSPYIPHTGAYIHKHACTDKDEKTDRYTQSRTHRRTQTGRPRCTDTRIHT